MADMAQRQENHIWGRNTYMNVLIAGEGLEGKKWATNLTNTRMNMEIYAMGHMEPWLIPNIRGIQWAAYLKMK